MRRTVTRSDPTGPRLFLALWPDDEVRRQIADWASAEWPATAAPVPSERLHLTLHFIGTVPSAEVDALRTALQVSFAGFSFRLDYCAVWSNGIAALTPLATPAALVRLHNDLEVVLRAHGLPVEERSCRPHVTLARRAQGTQLPTPPSFDWQVEAGYVLVHSMPGGVYRVIHHYEQ